MRRKLVAGNWKMNGSLAANSGLLSTLASSLAAGEASHGCDVAVCVPALYLSQCREALQGSAVAWGAQALLEMGAVNRLDPNMVAVLRWIDQPGDGLRREAAELADKTRKDTPAKLLALAVAMSGGSLTAPEFPPVLPPVDTCAKIVFGAIMAGAHSLADPTAALTRALASGEAMAQGG